VASGRILDAILEWQAKGGSPMRNRTVETTIVVLGILLAAGVLAMQSGNGKPAAATDMMPCADIDGDTTVSQIDLDIETTYFFVDFPSPDYEPATDMDGDGLIRGPTDILTVAGDIGAYTLCQDKPVTWLGGTPGKGGGLVSSTDLDGDGCDDADENGLVPSAGGARNYLSPWDYFNPSDDGMNDIDDVLAVIFQYSVDFGDPGYDTDTDRSALVGPDPWDLGPPDGVQDIADILAIIYQYAHDC
jgi:hypothetical protein